MVMMELYLDLPMLRMVLVLVNQAIHLHSLLEFVLDFR